MVFVSFSLPKETLQRIVSQAEKSGAVLVLRGLHGNSLTRMGEEIARLVGDRKVTAIIHPPAFKQFKVHQVPALVLARSGQASKIGEDGCAPGSSFIRVDGDVTQDYALDLIERQAPAWAEVARPLRGKTLGVAAMSKRWVFVLALLLASRVWAQGDAASSAFAEGKALGAGTIDSAFQAIGNGTGATTVPGFGLNTPPIAGFPGGAGSVVGAGYGQDHRLRQPGA